MNLSMLQAHIRDSGIMKKYLADKLGLTKSGFSNKITGKTQFTLEEADKLAKELRLTPSEKDKIFFK